MPKYEVWIQTTEGQFPQTIEAASPEDARRQAQEIAIQASTPPDTPGLAEDVLKGTLRGAVKSIPDTLAGAAGLAMRGGDELLGRAMTGQGGGLTGIGQEKFGMPIPQPGSRAADAIGLPRAQTAAGRIAEETAAGLVGGVALAPLTGGASMATGAAALGGAASGAAAQGVREAGGPEALAIGAGLAAPTVAGKVRSAVGSGARAARGAGGIASGIDDIVDDASRSADDVVAGLKESSIGRRALEGVQRELGPAVARTKTEALDDIAASLDDLNAGLRPSQTLRNPVGLQRLERQIAQAGDEAFATTLQKQADDLLDALDDELRAELVTAGAGSTPANVARAASLKLQQSDELLNAARGAPRFELPTGRIKNSIARRRAQATPTGQKVFDEVKKELDDIVKWGPGHRFDDMWDRYQRLGELQAKAASRGENYKAGIFGSVRKAMDKTFENAAKGQVPKGLDDASAEAVQKFREGWQIRKEYHQQYGGAGASKSILARKFDLKREGASLDVESGFGSSGTRAAIKGVVQDRKNPVGAARTLRKRMAEAGAEQLDDLEADAADYVLSTLTKEGGTKGAGVATLRKRLDGPEGDAIAELLGGKGSRKWITLRRNLPRIQKVRDNPNPAATGSASLPTKQQVDIVGVLYGRGGGGLGGAVGASAGAMVGGVPGSVVGGAIGTATGSTMGKVAQWIANQDEAIIHRLKTKVLLDGKLYAAVMTDAPESAFASTRMRITQEMLRTGVIGSQQELRQLGEAVRAEGQ